jgi:replicative DNA helicase
VGKRSEDKMLTPVVIRSAAELVVGVIDQASDAYECADAAEAEIRTGLRTLDTAIGGLRPGDLIVLTGAPASGKTSLLLNLVRHIAVDEMCPVVLIALQSKSEHILLRLAGIVVGVSPRKLYSGRLRDEDWCNLANAAEQLTKAPLLVGDQARMDVDAIDSVIASSIQSFGKCAFVAIDCSHLAQAGPVGAMDSDARAMRCGELKTLARRRDCAVLVVGTSVQSARSTLVESMPDADLLLELRRTGRFVGTALEQCELIVHKQPNGAPCTVPLYFTAASARFRSAV